MTSTEKTDVSEFTPNPNDLQYTPEMADRAREFKLIKAGTMRGVVVGAEAGVIPSSKNLFVRLRCAPVDKNNHKVPNAVAELTLVLPMSNPKVADHTPPDTESLCWRALCALDPKFPRYPRKRKDGNGFETSDKEPISKDAYRALQKEVRLAVGQRMVELWKDPRALLDETFFMTVEHYAAKNGTTYARIREISATPRDGVTVLEENLLA